MTSFRKLLLFALFLTFDLIMFGAFVRVTDAGLGCPDWPGCYGKVTPIGAMDTIRAEAAARPDGPVTPFKAWVEMLHRYVAAALGLIIIVLAVMASRRRAWPATEVAPGATGGGAANPVTAQGAGSARPARPSAILAWVTVFWVCLQGAFGAWTVTMQLKPIIVTAHLLGGMVLYALLLEQVARLGPHRPLAAAAGRHAGLAALAIALVFVQIALGGWVSSNYATLACQDFPLCQGSAWPPMDFAAGFEPWRRLGMTGEGGALPFAALTAIHYVHRLFAYLVFAVVGVLAWRIGRHDELRRTGRWLLAVLALQLATGLTNIFLDWPLAAAVLHTGGAAALLGLLLVLRFRLRAVGAIPARLQPTPRRAAA